MELIQIVPLSTYQGRDDRIFACDRRFSKEKQPDQTNPCELRHSAFRRTYGFWLSVACVHEKFSSARAAHFASAPSGEFRNGAGEPGPSLAHLAKGSEHTGIRFARAFLGGLALLLTVVRSGIAVTALSSVGLMRPWKLDSRLSRRIVAILRRARKIIGERALFRLTNLFTLNMFGLSKRSKPMTYIMNYRDGSKQTFNDAIHFEVVYDQNAETYIVRKAS